MKQPLEKFVRGITDFSYALPGAETWIKISKIGAVIFLILCVSKKHHPTNDSKGHPGTPVPGKIDTSGPTQPDDQFHKMNPNDPEDTVVPKGKGDTNTKQ